MGGTRYHEQNLPTLISTNPDSEPPIGEGDADELPTELLPVWPERDEQHRMEAEASSTLLETLSQVHYPGPRVLTT